MADPAPLPLVLAGKVVDAHSHVASLDFIPPSFVEGVIDNLLTAALAAGAAFPRARLREICHAALGDEDATAHLAEMRDAGIEHSVLLIADLTYRMRDARLTVEEMFTRHRDLRDRHPGAFAVFGGVDPRWGRDGVDLFERSVAEWGFSGFKVYPPCGFSPSDPALFPFYEICAAHRVPVLIHIGPTSPALSFEFSSPFTADEAARSFPGVNFILAHGAVHHAEEAAMLCEHRPNVYIDLSGLQSKLRMERETGWLRHVFRRGINHKVIFGTDWPLFRMQGTQRSFVEDLAGPDGLLRGLGEADLGLIFHGNIRRLLPARAFHPLTEPACSSPS